LYPLYTNGVSVLSMVKKRQPPKPVINITTTDDKPFYKMQVVYTAKDGTKKQLFKSDGLHGCQIYAQGFIEGWNKFIYELETK